MKSWIEDLQLAPLTPFDSLDQPAIGLYQGTFLEPRFSIERPTEGLKNKLLAKLKSSFTQKKWLYFFVASPDVALSGAIVDLGYAGNAFCSLIDLKTGEMIFDHSWLGVPKLQSKVGNRFFPDLQATFDNFSTSDEKKVRIKLTPAADPDSFLLSVEIENAIKANLRLSNKNRPPMIALANPTSSRLTYTQKLNLLKAEGSILVTNHGEYRFDSDSLHTYAGLDLTIAHPLHQTEWNWAFAGGQELGQHEQIGFNLAAGNHLGGLNENCLWLGERTLELPPVRFINDKKDRSQPWKIISPDRAVQLEFRPLNLHAEDRNLILVKTEFEQWFGRYSGTIQLNTGHTLVVENLTGVAEEQKVRW